MSALEQVISLDVRSSLINVGCSYNAPVENTETSSEKDGAIPQKNSSKETSQASDDDSCANEMQHIYVTKISEADWSQKDKLEPVEGEINYLNILNRNTPTDIVFYAWAPVPDNFYARLDLLMAFSLFSFFL